MSGHSQKAKPFESAYTHDVRHAVSRTRTEKSVASRFASPQFEYVTPSAPRSTKRVICGMALIWKGPR